MLSHEELHLNKCKFLSDNFFQPLCYDKSVLEIGCFDGHISKVIDQHQPRKLVLVEANEDSARRVAKDFAHAEVIYGDMHKDLQKVGKVDTAIVLGVIYHSHAPLMLIEEIVNCCDPKDILIDNLSPVFRWRIETPNMPGNRHVMRNQKTCNILIDIDNQIMITSFENLGYRLVQKSEYPQNARAPGLPIFHFTRL